jgi:UDP-N-acetylglucosamine 2-epimerase (non-hydrolysing)
VQEETTYLGIPCATLRENTERPVTVTEGTNRLLSADKLVGAVQSALKGEWPKGRRPDRWDGRSAERACASLRRWLRA